MDIDISAPLAVSGVDSRGKIVIAGGGEGFCRPGDEDCG